MSQFLEQEKKHQAEFKSRSQYVSQLARKAGIYKGHPYAFCFPDDCRQENLFPETRRETLAYFDRHSIKWHDGRNGEPSNHMCDSQVCCVNFLSPFSDKPEALADLLRFVYSDLVEMIPIEDGRFVAFEWIGEENYLEEILSGKRKRSRGALFTSADAAVMFANADGGKHFVLIEWKYTESYSPSCLKISASGRDRTQIYRRLYEAEDCPLSRQLIPQFEGLFYEPFYQLMRQQLLANEMEKAHELGADLVGVLHIAPAQNHDFLRITSPELQGFGNSATTVWSKLVRSSGKFHSIYAEQLFGKFTVSEHPDLSSWWDYITTRYAWIIR